jgi:cell fate regulator YaaT (PSP1 superfamily)
MERAYLVRYGQMGHVGRFAADCSAYERGQTVVVESARGVELGEVLLGLPDGTATPPSAGSAPARVLRPAAENDLARAQQVAIERSTRLLACEGVFRNGAWPLELIDVEPMLEGRRTVLHYLGPHRLDTAGLVQALRDTCGLEVWLEPAGRDVADDEAEHDGEAGTCQDCGATGGCGTSNGGCGTKTGTEAGGCTSCAVKDLIRNRHT